MVFILEDYSPWIVFSFLYLQCQKFLAEDTVDNNPKYLEIMTAVSRS